MNSPYIYSVLGGELVVTERQGGTPKWKGHVNGLSVEAALPVPDSGDCIVLLSWREAEAARPRVKNLVRCSANGEVLWEVENASKIRMYGIERADVEVYTRARLRDGTVEAFSVGGFIDYIDIRTGQIMNSVFTK